MIELKKVDFYKPPAVIPGEMPENLPICNRALPISDYVTITEKDTDTLIVPGAIFKIESCIIEVLRVSNDWDHPWFHGICNGVHFGSKSEEFVYHSRHPVFPSHGYVWDMDLGISDFE